MEKKTTKGCVRVNTAQEAVKALDAGEIPFRVVEERKEVEKAIVEEK
jgi:hypothetical protein